MDSADSSGLVRPFLSLLLNIFKYRVNDYNFRCFFLNNMYRFDIFCYEKKYPQYSVGHLPIKSHTKNTMSSSTTSSSPLRSFLFWSLISFLIYPFVV